MAIDSGRGQKVLKGGRLAEHGRYGGVVGKRFKWGRSERGGQRRELGED